MIIITSIGNLNELKHESDDLDLKNSLDLESPPVSFANNQYK